MRYPNEKSIWEDLVFLCICFSRLAGWPWPPSSMQIQKPGTQGVENINTSLLLIRVSLPTSGSRGKWGAIAEVSFLWDKCHMGSVNKCDYVKGNSSTLILHTWCNLYDHFAISHSGTRLIRTVHHRGIWFNYPLIRGWETSLNEINFWSFFGK